MKQRLLILALEMLMVFTAACSGGTGSGGSSNEKEKKGNESSEAKQVELRIMWWGDQKRADITNEALKIFQEKKYQQKYEEACRLPLRLLASLPHPLVISISLIRSLLPAQRQTFFS